MNVLIAPCVNQASSIKIADHGSRRRFTTLIATPQQDAIDLADANTDKVDQCGLSGLMRI